KIADCSMRDLSRRSEVDDDRERHRADDDEHDILTQLAGLQAAERVAQRPGPGGRQVYQTVDEVAVDEVVEMRDAPRPARQVMDQAVNQLLVDRGNDARNEMHRADKQEIVKLVEVPLA